MDAWTLIPLTATGPVIVNVIVTNNETVTETETGTEILTETGTKK